MYHLLTTSIPLSFNPLPTAKKAFLNPTVIAHKCNASLRVLLVHSTLSHENSFSQQPAGIKKMQPLTLPHLFFSPRGSNKLYFFTTNEARKITDSISCTQKISYLIECKRCYLQYIGETKRQLSERFGEHRRSILNHQQFSTTTPVSLRLNQASHSINYVGLILTELIRSKLDSVRKTRKAHLMDKAKTLHPFGINRRDEARQCP